MRIAYRWAVLVGAIGLASIIWGLAAPSQPQPFGFAAAALPITVMLAVRTKVGSRIALVAGAGGATIAVGVAVLSHGLVLGFAYLFFLGFADQAVQLLEALWIDPWLTTALGSPWAILLLAELVVVAPFTEEFGKALSGVVSRPADRRQAFLAGVTAGTAFAVVENLVYAVFAGVPWNQIVLARSLGAAVHPLAAGLVMIGWWEWSHGGTISTLTKRFLAGVGVHALWNGSLVVLTVTETAFELNGTGEAFAQLSLIYTAALGASLAACLWRVSGSVAVDREQLVTIDLTEPSTIAAWTVLSASLLVPVALLLAAFPDFYRGN